MLAGGPLAAAYFISSGCGVRLFVLGIRSSGTSNGNLRKRLHTFVFYGIDSILELDGIRSSVMEPEFKCFIETLNNSDYKENFVINKYRNPKDEKDAWHYRFDIKDGEKIIQSFLLMSPIELKDVEKSKYPFYRVFKQNATKDSLVLPACFIVSKKDNGDWGVYNCNCPEQELNFAVIFDYKKAVERFNKRWNSISSVEMLRKIRVLCWAATCIIIALAILDLMFNLGLNNYIPVMVFILILVLFPIMLPYLTSVTLSKNGLGFSIDKDE